MSKIHDKWNEFVRYRHAYALAAAASLGSIFYGWDIGLIGGILSMASFQAYFGLDKKTATDRANLSGNIVSVLQAGCFFGALSTGYFAGRFGRKPSLIAAGIIFIIGSLIQTLSGYHTSHETGLSVLYFSRFFGGWGVGMVSALVPTYVSECAPKSIRGRCTGMIQLSNNLGIMLAFWVNYSASKNMKASEAQWRMPFAVQMVPGVLFLLCIAFQPESPRWLTEHGQHERAKRATAFINGLSIDSETVHATVIEMQRDFEGRAQLSIWQQLKFMVGTRTMVYRSIVPSLVMFFQQWTGTNAINYYSPTIFAQLGVKGQNSGLFATGIYGVVKVVSVATVIALAVEGLGRKKCLIIGGLVQAATMFWIAGYVSLDKSTSTHVGGSGYVSIICVYLYAVGYCIGWGPVPWVVASEVTPNPVRTIAMALAIGVNWLFSFLISRVTPNMLGALGYGTFLLFGCMCVVMVIWTFVGLPETAGIALEDMHLAFDDKVVLRSLQDAPGGRIFLGGQRVPSIEEMKASSLIISRQGDAPIEEEDVDKGNVSPTADDEVNV